MNCSGVVYFSFYPVAEATGLPNLNSGSLSFEGRDGSASLTINMEGWFTNLDKATELNNNKRKNNL